jgi:predicted XRE-type DNA-binding protein
MTDKKFIYPSEQTLRKMDRKLAKKRGSTHPRPGASPIELLKHDLCAEFVRYFLEQEISQRELAKTIGLSEARTSEILNYRHDRFTADHLIKYLFKIRPDLKLKVA